MSAPKIKLDLKKLRQAVEQYAAQNPKHADIAGRYRPMSKSAEAAAWASIDARNPSSSEPKSSVDGSQH